MHVPSKNSFFKHISSASIVTQRLFSKKFINVNGQKLEPHAHTKADKQYYINSGYPLYNCIFIYTFSFQNKCTYTLFNPSVKMKLDIF